MKPISIAVILLLYCTACNKENLAFEENPAGNTPYLLATLNDEPLPKFQNWDYGLQTILLQDRTVFILSTTWGKIDTVFINGDPNIRQFAHLDVQLRRSSDSPLELSSREQVYAMIKPRKVKYCLAGPYTSGVCIRFVDKDFRSWRSDYGDNANSYFLISGRGDSATKEPTITYSAAFSCRVYDDFGNSKILKGDFNSAVKYFE